MLLLSAPKLILIVGYTLLYSVLFSDAVFQNIFI